MNESSEAKQPTNENLLGIRIVAGIIDIIILALLGLVMTLLFGESSSEDSGFELSLSGLPFVIYVLLSLGYYFGMEVSHGQTVGKIIMGLRVVALNGELTPGSVAIRTVLRLVDGFLFYLVAVIVIAVSKDHQRIGDMAAGTRVVRA